MPQRLVINWRIQSQNVSGDDLYEAPEEAETCLQHWLLKLRFTSEQNSSVFSQNQQIHRGRHTQASHTQTIRTAAPAKRYQKSETKDHSELPLESSCFKVSSVSQ